MPLFADGATLYLTTNDLYFGLAASTKINLLHFEKQHPLIGKFEVSKSPLIFLHSVSLKVS